MEELLSATEITEVLSEACKPEFQIENLYHFTNSKLHVSMVSKKGLIFIHGNDYTGMEHIRLRHGLTSRKLFEKDGKFDIPTKFTLAPIEYPFVADAIFTPENLNTDRNNRPDLFDRYSGDFGNLEKKIYRYTLILYKSTGIVHTFFLSTNSKPYNKKVNLPLSQGWCSSNHNLSTGMKDYSINYRDVNDVVRFTIYLRSNPKTLSDRWYLIVYDIKGNALFTHFLLQETLTSVFEPGMMMRLDFQDLSTFDRIIKKIINGDYEFEKNFDHFSSYSYS